MIKNKKKKRRNSKTDKYNNYNLMIIIIKVLQTNGKSTDLNNSIIREILNLRKMSNLRNGER